MLSDDDLRKMTMAHFMNKPKIKEKAFKEENIISERALLVAVLSVCFVLIWALFLM